MQKALDTATDKTNHQSFDHKEEIENSNNSENIDPPFCNLTSENNHKEKDIQESKPDEPTREELDPRAKNPKRLIEALLFATNDPIPLKKIHLVLSEYCDINKKEILAFIETLKEEYKQEERSFTIEEIAEGFVLRTRPEYGPYISSYFHNKKLNRLSNAATEVLAIITYRQPVTRAQIDAIRGIDSSGTLQSLIEKNLVEPKGKLEAPGRPTLYGTTKEFLKQFGLKDEKSLPPLEKEN